MSVYNIPTSVLTLKRELMKLYLGLGVLMMKNLLLQDRGDEFTYTGSGGKNLAGNKRIGSPSADQTLTNMNRYSLLLEFVKTI